MRNVTFRMCLAFLLSTFVIKMGNSNRLCMKRLRTFKNGGNLKGQLIIDFQIVSAWCVYQAYPMYHFQPVLNRWHSPFKSIDLAVRYRFSLASSFCLELEFTDTASRGQRNILTKHIQEFLWILPHQLPGFQLNHYVPHIPAYLHTAVGANYNTKLRIFGGVIDLRKIEK